MHKVGTFLPPENELAKMFGVSRPTLRAAEDDFVRRGILIRHKGVGCEIAAQPKGFGRSLVFLCHDLSFFASALHCFCETAEKHNYYSAVVPLSGNRQSQERILETVLLRNPSGIAIYTDPAVPELDGLSLLHLGSRPVLYLVRRPEGFPGDLLSMDNGIGLLEIVCRFYESGCRKIALYADKDANPRAVQERSAGFFAGLKRCRLKMRPELICTEDRHLDAFFRVFDSATHRPDAVCCMNDRCAGNFIRETQKRGIDLRDIRLSGYDNLPLNEFLPYPVTTVEQPLKKLGELAAEMLIHRVENPAISFLKKNIHSKIIYKGF